MWLVDELVEKAPQAAPPVIVSGLTFWGVSLQDWVYILTIVYILIQIVKPVFRWLMGSKDDT
ncbi:holin [Vibrio phage vB_VpaP_G1]|uniref:Holin n=1 Tax=Vibrio phage vB_VpaP_G1 TaxID=2862773 RepID=A0AAE7WU25_9CAUD|nr:holin [Vibrio phage vB_VpaP_G1]QYW05820.1 holin [Vibrio phage vB_VpaP_G1]